MKDWLKTYLNLFFLSLILYCNVLWALDIVSSSEFMVNVNTTGHQYFPAIASLGNSKFVISFASEVNLVAGWRLYARIFDSNGSNLTTEFLVSSKASDYIPLSSIKSLDNGESFVITWMYAWSFIYAKIFSSLGTNLTDDIMVDNLASGYRPSVCSLEDERYFVVTWRSGVRPFARIFYSNGSALGPRFRVSTNASTYYIDVTSLDQGSSFLIVWLSDRDILGKKFYSNGTNMTSELPIYFNTSRYSFDLSVSEIINGFIVTWQDGGRGSTVFARLFKLNGTAITNDFQVNDNSYYDNWNEVSKVASIDNGKKFVITWVGWGSAGLQVYAKVYDSNGSILTQEFIVNTYIFYLRMNPAITSFSNGNSFAITWMSNGQDGSGYGIYAKIFSIQNCNNASDYFYSNNKTCLSCNSKSFTPNNITEILSCDFICPNGLYYFAFLSKCSDCKFKGYQKSNINGFAYCELICDSSKYYHIYKNSCLASCPIGLNSYRITNEYSAKICDFVCYNNTYLLSFNLSCISECNAYGFQPQVIDGKKICSFNCTIGSYLMTSNNTCQSKCDSLAFRVRNESNYLFCDFKCSNSTDFYFPANNSCHPSCPKMYYNNYTHQICSLCSENCSDCRDYSYCYNCIPPYQAINGICVNLSSTNNTSTPVFTPSISKENIVGSLTLPSIELLTLSTDQKTVYITSDNRKKLLAIDVQDLQNPNIINSINLTDGQALRLIENIIYLADSSSGLKIFNAMDPKNLISLGVIPQTNVKDIVIDKSRKIAVIINPNGTINLYNVGNLSSPNFISSIPITLENTTVYKMTLSNDGKRIYVSSSTGFYAIDISNPPQPVVLKSMKNIISNSHASNSLDSNFIYLTEASGGIKVLDLTNIDDPKIVESIASSKIQSISCYSGNCFVSSGSNLIVFDSSKISSLSNKGAVPTYSLANDFVITNDMKFGFLIDGAISLRILDFQSSPSYFLYIKHKEMEIGRKYTDNLLIYNLRTDSTYNLFSASYKFSKLSFYAVSFNPDSSLSKTFTNLPYWIDFDPSTNVISSNPDSAPLIGQFNLYGAFSLAVPKDIFVGIGPITNIEESSDLILHLSRYIDEKLYLTSTFDPNNVLLLKESQMIYEKDIRQKLAQYYFPMLTVIQVVSSLKLNQNHDTRSYLNITTASLYSITISLTLNSTKVRFMNKVTQALAKLNEEENSILLTAGVGEINQALYNLRLDMNNSIDFFGGIVVINDALNPISTTNITKMERFFLKNGSPLVNIPIQKQINSISIVTGSQMNIFLDKKTFLDPDEDSLTYKLVSAQNDDNLPSWIDFKDMMISGIPPDQLYYELTLIIRASDGYKSVDEKFTLHIEPSLWYLFQLGASFAGPLVGILGLWVYASKIYNIFCQELYKYPYDFTVEANKELKMQDIFPIALISEYLKEADILISMLKSKIKEELKLIKVSRRKLVEYFLSSDSPNNYIDEKKIIKKLNKILAETSSNFIASNLRNYFYNSKYSRNRIYSLIIFRFHIWYMAHPSQSKTQKAFKKLKKNWIDLITVDSTEPIRFNGLPNIALKRNFDDHPNLNIKSLEKALISYAQLKHNIKSDMTQVKISAKQKSSKQNFIGKINNFLNGDSFSPSNDIEESERHGISYKIEWDIIFFKGTVSEYFRGKMLIVNIFNNAGRILRQFKIKENRNLTTFLLRRPRLNSRFQSLMIDGV